MRSCSNFGVETATTHWLPLVCFFVGDGSLYSSLGGLDSIYTVAVYVGGEKSITQEGGNARVGKNLRLSY
jgi:hypothetical protein